MLGIIAETAEDALKNWDAGEPVFTVELGGLGPGYEQCIHIGIFELVRAMLAERSLSYFKVKDDWKEMLDVNLHVIDKANELGLSGAQAGVIKSFVHHVLIEGWADALRQVPKERHIQVSKHWPQLLAYSKQAAGQDEA